MRWKRRACTRGKLLDVAQVVITLVSALFGASLPVLLGFFAYRWQRSVDRQERLYEEKRKAYAELLLSLTRLHIDWHQGSDGTVNWKPFEEAMSNVAIVSMYAPQQVTDIARGVLSGIVQMPASTSELGHDRAENSISKLAEMLRKDLFLAPH